MTKILIVDDDKQATDLLQKILTTEGYETTAVNDSSKAVQIADSVNPHLIILDLMMPDPDGFKVCRLLRQIPSFMFTPIIIVTALDDTDSRVVAFGAGADDYLTKPFHIEELSNRVKDLLQKTEWLYGTVIAMPKCAPLCSDVLKVGNLRELAEAVDTLMAG